MAAERSEKPSYDPKPPGRRVTSPIAIGITTVVALLAIGLSGCSVIVTGHAKPQSAAAEAIRVTSGNLVTNEGTTEPKVVLSLYEDFLCPACRRFETTFGSTIKQMIADGSLAADYYMISILDSPANQRYSSRAGAAGYCVADDDNTPTKDAFMRFHAALYAQQPDESGPAFPTNEQLIETARQAGVTGTVPDCINSNRNIDMVQGLASATNVNATPTVRINGQDYELSTPADLLAKVKETTG
jgi:protein-disulfide isomerase